MSGGSGFAPTGNDGDLPCFEVYVKSSFIDANKRGSCPICHQYLLLSCHLAVNDAARFKVITIDTQRPLPESFKEKTRGKVFPVVIGISGKDVRGQDIANLVADSFDEVEQFYESINSTVPLLQGQDKRCQNAMSHFDNVYKDFNAFIQNSSKDDKHLVKDLANIDGFLQQQGTKFLCGDTLSFADCFLMPRLQHIRVAGKAYREFEIPASLSHLWAYMAAMYDTEEFNSTIPSDEDIVLHYETKAHRRVSVDRLRDFSYTKSVP